MFLFSTSLVVFSVIVVVSGQTETGVSPGNPCEGVLDNDRVLEPGTLCQQFRSCYEGTPREPQDCPIGTLFDKNTGECEHKYNVTCDEAVPRTLDDDVCMTRARVDLQCREFFWCANGRNYEIPCGEGTYYSNSHNVCVHSWQLTKEERKDCGL